MERALLELGLVSCLVVLFPWKKNYMETVSTVVQSIPIASSGSIYEFLFF
jgi:hypothetical protein